ncbi:MAG: hypothetical protein KA886_07000 [Candidatus Cloacimonetes bacterium]|nr:hypothetical protein [Candidatus Cloacimonadota bacterium]
MIYHVIKDMFGVSAYVWEGYIIKRVLSNPLQSNPNKQLYHVIYQNKVINTHRLHLKEAKKLVKIHSELSKIKSG